MREPVLGYLGPEGSHSEAAAERLRMLWPGLRLSPEPTLDRMVAALVGRRIDGAVVPVENSIEGSVDRVLDLLAEEPGLQVSAEWVLPVDHHLLGRAGTPLTGPGAPIQVLSHPQALAQCRMTLARLLPGAEPVPTASTAEAARRVAAGNGLEVCVGSLRAAERYGLTVLRPHLQDQSVNHTRFWLLTRGRWNIAAEGRRKAAVVFGFAMDRPGNLYRALELFARRGVNLTRLESRPVGSSLGAYRFFAEIDGDRSESRVAEGVDELGTVAGYVRLLGEYPVLEPQEGSVVTTGRARGALPAEAQEKLARIEAWLDRTGYDALLIERRDNFAWLTGGARNHVGKATDTGAAWAVVRKGSCTVVTSGIEAERIRREELGGEPWEIRSYNWWDPAADPTPELLSGKAASDSGTRGTPDVHEEIRRLRVPLTQPEMERYRILGRETSEALETVARQILPGQSEWEIAAQMEAALWARGIEPTVTLVAADERLRLYRHPLPTDTRVRERVMLVTCGRRAGLIANITRIVSFAPQDHDLRRRHRGCATIDTALFLATTPGTPYSTLWRTVERAYAVAGFPDEWRFHHQGGPTGYEGRDLRLTPSSTEEVQVHQAFAWNPSIAGTKSEDTMLVTPDGPEWLTGPQDWPTLEVEWEGRRLRRPDILVRTVGAGRP